MFKSDKILLLGRCFLNFTYLLFRLLNPTESYLLNLCLLLSIWALAKHASLKIGTLNWVTKCHSWINGVCNLLNYRWGTLARISLFSDQKVLRVWSFTNNTSIRARPTSAFWGRLILISMLLKLSWRLQIVIICNNIILFHFIICNFLYFSVFKK